jgi:DNA polymerase-3 subunit epsilon
MGSEREIILDTETTGLSPKGGDRIVEIGCVEMVGKIKTGRHFHAYVNPERDIPQAAINVHGITYEMVKDKPIFEEIAPAFLEFIQGSALVIHNASFDLSFLNFELERIAHKDLRRMQVVDTLALARQQYPGSPVNLDALCRRYGVSLERRDKHGALLDSELLADVYVYLCGGPQGAMFAGGDGKPKQQPYLAARTKRKPVFARGAKSGLPPSDEEAERHAAFLKKIASPLWNG